MGRPLLIWRLVVGSLRRRPVEALLTVVAIAAATTTLTFALALYGVTAHPYDTTRAATAGPDILAMPLGGGPPGGPAAVLALRHAPGVAGSGGPYPVAFPVMRVNGKKVLAIAEGRSTAGAPIDQPFVTGGTWVRGGGVVVERSFAAELGVNVGDPVDLGGRRFEVVGTAVTAALPPYPQTADYVPIGPGVGGVASQDTGLVWITEGAARSLATTAARGGYMLDLKLSDPARAEAFENLHGNNQVIELLSWRDIGKADAQLLVPIRRALLIASWLLGLLAIASLAVVVGGQMTEGSRRVGALKAIGATPRLVAGALLGEYLALALVAAATGLAVGFALEPLLTQPGAGLLGTAGAPSMTVVTVGWVVVLAVAVAILAAFVPSMRAARTTTTTALADAANNPKRRALMVAAAARLPVPLLLGLRLAARRPRRMVLTAFSTTITVTTLVAVLTVHAHQVLRINFLGRYSALPDPHLPETDKVLAVLTIVLVVLAAVNAIVVTWATSVDSRQPLAVARALGASPNQIRAGLLAALLLPALPGALAGVPLDVLLVKATGHGSTVTVPPASWLVAVVLATLAILAGLSLIAAGIGSRRSAAETLQAELA